MQGLSQLHSERLSFLYKVPVPASKIIRTASEMREHADYEDFFVASRQMLKNKSRKLKDFIIILLTI